MAVDFDVVGPLASNAATTSLTIVIPTFTDTDPQRILIAVIQQKANQVISAPAGWTKFVEVNNTANQRVTLAWKRAAAGDSGGGATFTKPVDDNLLFCGVIAVFKGCRAAGDPLDATTPTTSANASSDTVTYADFDPTETSAYVVAVGCYNDDSTTAGSISGTDPTFSNLWDLETATGTDSSIFGYGGASTGAATGARSHSTTSSADAISVGVLFGLRAAPVLVAGQGSYAVTGQPVALAAGKTMQAAQGSYALNGQVVTLAKGFKVDAAQGSYALTGQPVTLLSGRRLQAVQGAYALSGQSLNLLAGKRLVVDQGAYALAGQAVTLTFGGAAGFTMPVAQGSYVLSGQAVQLLAGHLLAAAQGGYALNGQGVNLPSGRRLIADLGVYSLAGFAVLLVHAGVAVVLPRYVTASLDVAAGRTASSDLTSGLPGDLRVASARIATLEED